jgi:hypothetical protein
MRAGYAVTNGYICAKSLPFGTTVKPLAGKRLKVPSAPHLQGIITVKSRCGDTCVQQNESVQISKQ